jgi:hypothetical protein
MLKSGPTAYFCGRVVALTLNLEVLGSNPDRNRNFQNTPGPVGLLVKRETIQEITVLF